MKNSLVTAILVMLLAVMMVLSACSTREAMGQHPEKDPEIIRMETKPVISKKNYLMEDTVSYDYIEMQNEQLYVLGSDTLREDIRTITFLNSMNQAPSGYLMDVSRDGNESVVAWLQRDAGSDLYDLYIAANGDIVAAENCRGMFAGYTSLEELKFSDCFDTSCTTDMTAMFMNCSSLDMLDLSCFDTSNVVDMTSMFQSVSWAKKLNIRSFDTGKVRSMRHMFSCMGSLEELDVRHFNTSDVSDMGAMFEYCSLLKELDLSSFDTSGVYSMDAMFYRCMSLKTVNVGSFDTSDVVDMSSMFAGCSNLQELDVSHFDTYSVNYMSGMFEMCSSLKELDLSNFETLNVMDMMCMFRYCEKMQYLDIRNFAFNWWDETDLPGDLFMGIPESATIKLPQGYSR